MDPIRPAIATLASLACLSAPHAPARAGEVLPGPYEAVVERVVDGDTLGVRVRVWLGQEVSVLVRIRGIDAPERRGRCASEKARAADATDALARLVGTDDVVLARIEGGKYYGRVIADVTTGRGEDVGASLLAEGLARPYEGGRRRPWCRADELARAEN